MPIKSYYYSFLEVNRYIAVRSPPGLIKQGNETRWYSNATIQLLYFNIINKQFIQNIDLYTMMNSLEERKIPIITKIS